MLIQNIYDSPAFQQYHHEWNIRRGEIDRLAEICLRSEKHRIIGNRLMHCGRYHEGRQLGENLIFLNVSHCGVRACPDCQAYRQYKQTNNFALWIEQCVQHHPDLNFIFLSIGFTSCPVQELCHVNRLVRDGFRQLFRKTNTRLADGWINFFEFTIRKEDLIHFNTHSILAFDTNRTDNHPYLLEYYWTENIRRRFKLDTVNVDLGVFQQRGIIDIPTQLKNAFFYSTKPQDYIPNRESGLHTPDTVTYSLIDQLTGSRAVCSGGLFKSYPKQFLVPKKKELAPIVHIYWDKEPVFRLNNNAPSKIPSLF